MRGWWQDLTDLVLPAECGGCGRPRAVLCPECRAVLSGSVPCRVRPEPEPAGLPVVHAAARYADEVRAVLLAHKERGALALAAPLGVALARAVRVGLREAAWAGGDREAAGPAWAADRVLPGSGGLAGSVTGWAGGPAAAGGRVPESALAGRVGVSPKGSGRGVPGPVEGEAVLLVPVPSARRAVAARGHDPARRIALAAAGELRRCGVPARVVGVLRQRRGVADQTGLDARERLANLTGALGVVPGGGRLLLAGPVVLVDDLMTTGASLAEAARAVRAAAAGEAGSAARATGAGEVGLGPGRAVRVPGGDGCGRQGGGSFADSSAATPVYDTAAREGTGRRTRRSTGAEMGTGIARMRTSRAGDIICAAVVAASPDAFEINRN
ncbi:MULTISPECIES: ComF family protein [unclassified Streptomyces]|uniref:ComF family protein n=1 Tax=unclassified Streptomyces TaxID=2593676 RepID=UPI0036E05A09